MPIELVLIPGAGAALIAAGLALLRRPDMSERARFNRARADARRAGEEARERIWDEILDARR